MGHLSVPAAPPVTPPLPGSCQVRCARCHEILTVAPGISEFSCPKCQLPQMLPPELMLTGGATRRQTPPAQGIDPTKIQLPCARCKAILNVPHGLTRFNCPQCGVDLAVDLSKLHQYFSSVGSSSIPGLPQDFQEETNEVAVDVELEEDEGGAVGETFMDYRPPKLSLGDPHPDPVVETSSLSAVQPPEPTYNLKIMDELEKSKALSCLQIETIVYACQRHLQHLQNGTRAGFFIGDGAGVGKGRTIAGLIWENWKHGNQKALWISVGSDLKFDARRDLDDAGAAGVEVHALNKLPYSKLDSKAVGIKDGVVFLTYNSLIASSEKGRSRLHQLLQWCESDFDGLIVFDECHKAKNLIPEAGGQATRTGEAVLEIQVLFEAKQWDHLVEQFKQEFYKLFGMTVEPLLNIYLQAGLSSLKTPSCYEEGCPKEDPLSQESFRRLAEPLPFSKQRHSKLVCYITREVMDSENPPLVLPNGYVYSTKALEEMAKKNNGSITCPRSGYVCSYTDLVKAYIS